MTVKHSPRMLDCMDDTPKPRKPGKPGRKQRPNKAHAAQRRGGKVGGQARAEALDPERRTEIAQAGATARWRIPRAVCGSPDRPLRIGDTELQCYVLEDGTRVLSQAGFLEALGRHPKASVKREEGEEQTPPILQGKAIAPFISSEVLAKSQPIRFRLTSGKGRAASGYRADLLPDVCEIYLKARDAGVLLRNQLHIAKQAEILMRGLAHVGIIALVDEVTGYQQLRAQNALAEILEKFIAKELQAWVQTFPPDFYEQIFRLRGLEYPTASVKRPQYFGNLTNDIVYRRIAPGVLEELKRVTPRSDSGRPKHKYFQRLTSNVGYPKLREHLGAVVAIMQLSSDWHDFIAKLDRLRPKYGSTLPLPLGDNESDDGIGL